MKFWLPHSRPELRRLMDFVKSLWSGLLSSRRDAAAEPGDLDRVWHAECEEMDAILRRNDPGRSLR